MRELVPQSEIEMLDVDMIMEEEEVEDVLNGDFGCTKTGQTKVTLTKKASG